MKKRLFGIILAFLLCVSLCVPAFAQDNRPLLVDDADLLTENEEILLLAKLEEISRAAQMDIVVVTANDIGGKTPQAYADDFYDDHGYAADGVLLLVSMAERDWYISTSGYGIIAVTDAGRNYMSDQFIHDLSDGNYYEAFLTYAELCGDFIEQARNGQSFDVGHLPKAPFNVFRSILISLIIGLVIALIVTGVMVSKLKTVRSQNGAANYVKSGSMMVTQSRDLFLYRHIDRQAKPKESGSGGSSTHISSSGRTHGGGGGKF